MKKEQKVNIFFSLWGD